MPTFTVSPLTGATFTNIFSAICNLPTNEILINWGDSSDFDTLSTHVYELPGKYNVTLQTCSGKMYFPIETVANYVPTISLEADSLNLSAGCLYSFTAKVTGNNPTETLSFKSNTSSFPSQPVTFFSHLIPQYQFLDSNQNEISTYSISLTSELSINNKTYGYSGFDTFYYKDDLPKTSSIEVSIINLSACDTLTIDQHIPNGYFQLSGLSSFDIGFLADFGLPEVETGYQIKAFSALSSVDHFVFGGDNVYYNNGTLTALQTSFSAFSSVLSATENYSIVIGNHDRQTNTLSAYEAMFPDFKPYYTKTIHPGIDLFVLDSSFDSNSISRQIDGNTIGSKQYENFVRDISKSNAKFKIVAFHHPYLSNHVGRDRVYSEMDWKFEDFGVNLILNGHCHYTEILEKNGIGYVNMSRVNQAANIPSGTSIYNLYNSSSRCVARITFYPNKYVVDVIRLSTGEILYTYTNIISNTDPINSLESFGSALTAELLDYPGYFSVSTINSPVTGTFFEDVQIKNLL